MWASREVMQVHGIQLFSYTMRGGVRSAFIRAFTTTCRLTGHPCNNKWIVGAPEEMGPAKGTAGTPSSAGETGQPSINAHGTYKENWP